MLLVVPGDILVGAVAGIAAAGAVFGGFYRLFKTRLALKEQEVLAQARGEGERLRKEAEGAARQREVAAREAFEREIADLRKELTERAERLKRREDGIDRKLDEFSKKERFIEKVERNLSETRKRVEAQQAELERTLEEEKRALAAAAAMNREQAIETLFARLERELEGEAAERIRRVSERVERESREKAREILVLAIQRCAASHTAATVVTTVDLPSDELKGRIIGREGRNIRAFEKATGVDVIVDDTPGVVILSSFDGVRRDVARRAMEQLIVDGRIHPARIEEVVAQVKKDEERQIVEIGKKAGYDAGVAGLHPKEVQLLGKLQFVTSQGRSVLAHSLEVAQLSGILAGELGLDIPRAKRIGLLHDIGRAADHDMEGSHSAIGADLARKCEESKVVVNALAAHHGEEPPGSLYAVVLQVADAISHERPGSAQENLDRSFKRMERLEEIARSFPAVTEAYAVQTGRELRVVVDPGQIPDRMTPKLARDIAKMIEGRLSYPGEIQVTVLREMRVRGFAKKA